MKTIIPYKFLFLVLLLFSISCGNEKKDEHAGHEQQQEVYTCPMHPEIIKNAPGTCPICGMQLLKKETGNIAVQDVELESLLRPANEFVVSTVPVTTLVQRTENIELKVVGTVAYDTRQTGVISSRVKGRIEKLYIRYKYQPVRKGQRVMDIYSPELVTAQQNLIFLLRNDPANASLINASKERLLLMGMTAVQVAEIFRSKSPVYSVAVFSKYSGFVTDLTNRPANSPADPMQPQTETNQALTIKEGMYVQNGQAVFSVYDPLRAWILLDIFPEQQSLLKAGNAVMIVPETAPHQKFRATVDYIEPIFRPGTKTLSARVYFNNNVMQLPIGSRVTASIFASPKNASWLPKEAVLSLGRERIVFRKEPGGFRAHKIATGIEINGFVQVTSELSPADSVASNAQFLVDNEAFIKVNSK
jgi:membrane fusion protein, copper/silver efflux system